MADLLPRYKWLVGKAFDRIPDGKDKKRQGMSRLTGPHENEDYHGWSPVDENEPLEMLYTGGTTKNPKGVPIVMPSSWNLSGPNWR